MLTLMIGFESLPLSNPSDHTIDNMFKLLWDLYEHEIREFIKSKIDEDLDTWEGGITEWWGWGSVFDMECGFKFSINSVDEGIEFVIYS